MLSDGGKNTVQAKQWLDKCYSDSTPSKTTFKRWYADFKRGCTDTKDAECLGHPNCPVVPENIEKPLKLILANHKLKLWEIAEELKISESGVVTWTFVNEEAVFKVGAIFAHSQSKTTIRWQFRVLFVTVSTQQKGVFA